MRNAKPTIAYLSALALLLTIDSGSAEATCTDPEDESATVSGPGLPGSALSASASHPTLNRTFVSSANSLYRHDIETLNMSLASDRFAATGTIVNTPNPVGMDTSIAGAFGVFVAQQNGIVRRVNPEAASFGAGSVWSRNLRRPSCFSDGLSATPVVQLRRFSSDSFKARFATDIVYVATRYSCAGGTTQNRVYALNADTGAIEWTFNGTATMDVDVAYEAPFLDVDEDRLILGTDRTSAFQDSLFSIDVITGSKAWSVNAGQIWTSPIVRGNRIYVGTLAGDIKAINKSDGVVLWTVAGGLPILTNIFAEFRPPYNSDPNLAEMIAYVDYFGQVNMVRDDGGKGSLLWTQPLSVPMSGRTSIASSRVAVDPSNGKMYIGDTDGEIFQLSMIDGAVEATRTLDSGVTVGDVSFVFNAAGGVEIIAGSADGVLSRFCGPWAGEYEVVPFAPANTSSIAPEPGICFGAGDCGADPSLCSKWSCVDRVCVPVLHPDGTVCDDGNPNTHAANGLPGNQDECNAGTCKGYSECQLNPGQCACREDDGSPTIRELYTREPTTCPSPPDPGGSTSPPPLPSAWCGTEVSEGLSQNFCLAHKGNAVTPVWVHLMDRERRPFNISLSNGNVRMRLCGSNASSAGSGAVSPAPANDGTCPFVTGDRPDFVDPDNNFLPLSNPLEAKLGLGGGLFASGRVGTYYAYISTPVSGFEASDFSNPWNIRVDVAMDSNAGGTCFDTTEGFAGLQIDFQVQMGLADTPSQDCDVNSDADHAGFLSVVVRSSSGIASPGAPVQVGWANDKFFAQKYEELVTNSPSLPNFGNTTFGGREGVIEFTDFGNYMNFNDGSSQNLPIRATCPGGTIGDANTVTFLPPTSGPHPSHIVIDLVGC